MVTVFVDAENVRRSLWPNLTRQELVKRAQAWGSREGHVVVLFETAKLDSKRRVGVEIRVLRLEHRGPNLTAQSATRGPGTHAPQIVAEREMPTLDNGRKTTRRCRRLEQSVQCLDVARLSLSHRLR